MHTTFLPHRNTPDLKIYPTASDTCPCSIFKVKLNCSSTQLFISGACVCIRRQHSLWADVSGKGAPAGMQPPGSGLGQLLLAEVAQPQRAQNEF